MMQITSVPLGLVSTQAPLISSSNTFSEAARQSSYLSNLCDHKERREGAYARDKLNIRANAPSPRLPKSSVQKGGAYFQELMVNRLKAAAWNLPV